MRHSTRRHSRQCGASEKVVWVPLLPVDEADVLFVGRGLVGWPIVALIALVVWEIVAGDSLNAGEEPFVSIIFISVMLIPLGLVAVYATKDVEADEEATHFEPSAKHRVGAVVGAVAVFVGLAVAGFALLVGLSGITS